MSIPIPPPIEPEGYLDGLVWSAVVRGAILDLCVSLVGSIPLVLWLAGPAAFSDDPDLSQHAVEQALESPTGLFWGALFGLVATVVGAFYGAHRAGKLHLKHGGWVAVMSAVLGLPFLLASGSGPTVAPLWYEVVTLMGMLPAGLLGGFLASRFERIR